MKLNDETLRFIHEHCKDDVRNLALQAPKYPGVDMPVALTQIAGRQAAAEKIPSWYAEEGILYPRHLSLEQCSSEATARYKASIIPEFSSGTLADLTGGFGIDCAFLSPKFHHVTYVERQEVLCEIASHNFPLLALNHIRIENKDAIRHLQEMSSADWIFIDPARRDGHGGKTVAIADCEPNVAELESLLLEKAQHVMVKLSPMLDLTLALNDLKHVREAHIVSVGNECKELLLVLGQQVHEEPSAPRVFCVNDNQRIDYDSAAYTQGLRIGGKPLPEAKNYLYEPNASIMKAGCFDLVEERFGVTQVGPSSHLFVSATPVADFPGRGFAIEAIGGMNKKDIKRLLNGTKQANIAVRNFPLTAPQLRKKLKLADGGPVYLFGTTMQGCDHVLLRTSKI